MCRRLPPGGLVEGRRPNTEWNSLSLAICSLESYWGRCGMTNILKRTANAANEPLNLLVKPANVDHILLRESWRFWQCVVMFSAATLVTSPFPSVIAVIPFQRRAWNAICRPKTRVRQIGASWRRIRLRAAAALFLGSQAMLFRHNDDAGSDLLATPFFLSFHPYCDKRQLTSWLSH